MAIPSADETNLARFARLALPYLGDAYRLARWLLGNEQDAKDAVQEAYAAACQCVDSFHGDDPRNWILAIVRNASYSLLRKRRAAGAEETFDEVSHSLDQAGLTLGQSDNNPETLLLERIERERVSKAIQRLPVKLREVLVLREMADLPYVQIAQIAGIPLGTVMSRLSRARDLLAAWLREQ